MNANMFEGTSFDNDDQLDFHRQSPGAMTFEELQRKKQDQREAATSLEAAVEQPTSPEVQAAERVLATGRFIGAYRQQQLEEQEAA